MQEITSTEAKRARRFCSGSGLCQPLLSLAYKSLSPAVKDSWSPNGWETETTWPAGETAGGLGLPRETEERGHPGSARANIRGGLESRSLPPVSRLEGRQIARAGFISDGCCRTEIIYSRPRISARALPPTVQTGHTTCLAAPKSWSDLSAGAAKPARKASLGKPGLTESYNPDR